MHGIHDIPELKDALERLDLVLGDDAERAKLGNALDKRHRGTSAGVNDEAGWLPRLCGNLIPRHSYSRLITALEPDDRTVLDDYRTKLLGLLASLPTGARILEELYDATITPATPQSLENASMPTFVLGVAARTGLISQEAGLAPNAHIVMLLNHGGRVEFTAPTHHCSNLSMHFATTLRDLLTLTNSVPQAGGQIPLNEVIQNAEGAKAALDDALRIARQLQPPSPPTGEG